jgi:hypothetical protein
VSFMDLDFGGKGEVKACTARRVVGSPQAAAMRFHNGSADAKSHAGAMRFYINQCPLWSTFLEDQADPTDDFPSQVASLTILDAALRASSSG